MGSLTIYGRIRLAVAALHRHDAVVTQFLSAFEDSLRHREVIVATEQHENINQVLQFFQHLAKRRDYNSVMVVTHGGRDGAINYEETVRDPGPGDALVENWRFLISGMSGAIENKLVIPAACYSGTERIVKLLLSAYPGGFALAVLATHPGRTLDVGQGAPAIAAFLDALADMNLTSYEEWHLREAEASLTRRHRDAVRLWFTGDI